MTERVKKRLKALKVSQYPICVEKVKYMNAAFRQNDGRPAIIRRSMAVANYLDNRTIFIQDGELIVGNIASKPMGMECRADQPTWSEEDLEDLLGGGLFYLADEDKKFLRSMDDYWAGKGRTKYEQAGQYYDDDRLWPFIKRGFLVPPWVRKDAGRGQGGAGIGWGLNLSSTILFCPDYAKIIGEGFEKQIEDVKTELAKVRYESADDIYKADYYHAALIALPAFIRIAKRYSELAENMAKAETNPVRKNELLTIAETCARVPAKPARTFREAIQAFYFYWVTLAAGTIPGGRFDQLMYPYYKADIEAGRLTRDEALELIELLRVKIMEFNMVGGGKGQREKWAGMARWHNFVLGGCDREGNDVTNELTYLMLEAAAETRTPHPTMTIRVNENTPPELMKKSLELVRTGLGMPAFISEKSYMNFMIEQGGVDPKEATEFAIGGCLDNVLPGRSRNFAFGMFIVPMVLELALYNGCNPKDGHFFGRATGEFTDFKTYEEFYNAFLSQLELTLGMVNEEHNIQLTTLKDTFPDPVISIFLEDGVKCGKDGLSRRMKFENASVLNMVGTVNVIDSLAAIKKLVFDEKTVSAKTMIDALRANWEGYEDIRQLCLKAPKFGNNDPYVDEIAARVWTDYARIAKTFKNIYGTPAFPTATSITAHAPGGALTSATPDGRRSGDTLADGSVSPAQGRDLNGPLAVLQSGMKLPQDKFMATLLNMKFTTSALKTDEDLEKLGTMVKTYLTNGGKHVQFNVVDRETLVKAKADKESYRDLIVRVAGYSAYFTVLTPKVQDEIIARTAHTL